MGIDEMCSYTFDLFPSRAHPTDRSHCTDRWHGLVATSGHWQGQRPRLYVHNLVVYAKQPLGGPEAVLEYLGRYTHRVAIANERIVGIDGNDVQLRVSADRATGRKQVVRLPGASSSVAFCSTCCRQASSASVTMGCSLRRGRKRGWLLPERRSTCRHRSL